MAKKKKQKVRAEFRKKYNARTRERDLTRNFRQENLDHDNTVSSERVSGKGESTRKRTIIGAEVTETESGGFQVHLDVDESNCLPGRVLSVHGLNSIVCAEDGTTYRCSMRGLLKTLCTDERHVIAAGDRVLIRPEEGKEAGTIERIEPRHGVLSRASRGRRHVIVTNVDQVLIVSSAAEPMIKPNLIDRFLVTAEKMAVKPIICINKADLVDIAELQPLVGVYSQMGYEVLLLSAETGLHIDELREKVIGKESVVAGQSGVGKSSLLNAIEPGLDLQVRRVSVENQKGRHTTTAARLIPLTAGGFLVDTPGIRQFQLWDITAEEVAGFYRDIRPYVSHCRFPDCTHTHEMDCAVKDAVADGRLDVRRYDSYCYLFVGDEP